MECLNPMRQKEGSNNHWSTPNFFTHKLINVFKHALQCQNQPLHEFINYKRKLNATVQKSFLIRAEDLQ